MYVQKLMSPTCHNIFGAPSLKNSAPINFSSLLVELSMRQKGPCAHSCLSLHDWPDPGSDDMWLLVR